MYITAYDRYLNDNQLEFAIESLAAWMLAAQLLWGFMGQVTALLPSDVRSQLAPIEVVQTTDANSQRLRSFGGAQVQAYVKTGTNVIYVAAWTKNFEKAQKGDGEARLVLAAQIAHESYHLKHPSKGERPAYAEQVRVLKAMGAPAGMIRAVMKSADYIAANPR